jgi:thioredoxin-like negative regulator of GroEL
LLEDKRMEYQIEAPQEKSNNGMLVDLLLIGAGGLFMFVAIVLIVVMVTGAASPTTTEAIQQAASLAELSGGKRVVHAPKGAVQISWLEQAGDIPVMVMFTADWCGYCRDLKPLLENSTYNAGYELLLVEVDVDECPALAAQYNVRGIPAVRAFVRGREVDRFTGGASGAEVADFVAGLPH